MPKPLGEAIRETFANANGNTVDPNLVSAKAPKGKAEELSFEMKLEEDIGTYFPTEAQASAVLEFCDIAIDAESSEASKRRQMVLLVHERFPNGLTYNQCKVFGNATMAISQYTYRQFVIAVKLHKKHGARYNKSGDVTKLGGLPKKSGGNKSGKRTVSPSVWQSTLNKTCKTLREHIGNIPKKDIEPDTLKEVTAILKALDAACAKGARVKVA